MPTLPRLQKCLVLGVASALAVAGSLSASEADTVWTEPVGKVELTIAPGDEHPLSIPLQAHAAHCGVVTKWENGVLTTDTAWGEAAFAPFSQKPFIVRFVSGRAEGRYFKVTSNTTNTLTLDIETALAVLPAVGDQFELTPVDTLEGIFGADGGDLATSSNPQLADNVILQEAGAWVTYYHTGTHWAKSSDPTTTRNKTPLLPDRGIIFVRRSTEPLQLFIAGKVALFPQVTPTPGNSELLLGNPFPVDVPLDELETPSGNGATIQIRAASGSWMSYTFAGGRWTAPSNENGNTPESPVIRKGTAIMVIHQTPSEGLHILHPPY